MGATIRRYLALAPARPKPPAAPRPRVTFYDLPAELRIEIYRLALDGVLIHVLPSNTSEAMKMPHPLTRTSRQVRNEVLPMIHAMCPIGCTITDFNFEGLLNWMKRIPPDEQSKLCKNNNLSIRFNHSQTKPIQNLDSLRKWLHVRADKYRPQPRWHYGGVTPHSAICANLRRKARRMKETGKQDEMLAILKSLGIQCIEPSGQRRAAL